jgi:hypothetical protein
MKIEIAESLILSWLRHVQGCAVTQLNWKPSPSWTLADEHALRQEFERIRTLASETIGVPIFKQGEFAQFVRQAEIDVLGFACLTIRQPRRRLRSTPRSTRRA